MSLFTSQYPSTHGILEPGTTPLSPTSITLAESLKNAGYETLYFGPNSNDFFPYDRGFIRGFTYIDTKYDYDRTNGLNNWMRGINQLNENRKNGKPTFLFLHTYYVHEPYLPGLRPLQFTNDIDENIPVTKEQYFEFTPEYMQFSKNYFRQNPVKTKNLELLYKEYMITDHFDTARRLYKELINQDCQNYCLQAEFYYTQQKDNKRDVSYMKALYDELISQLDTHLGDILTQLEPMLSEDTVLIITADHGEEFMEHGSIMHRSLYGEVLRIPLILSVPRATPRIIRNPVGIIDIYPTILGILGIPKNNSIEGRDMSDDIAGLPNYLLSYPVISERYDLISKKEGQTPIIQRTVITPRWKMYLRSLEGNTPSNIELYDVVNDPWDTTNIADKHPFVIWYLSQVHDKFAANRMVNYPQNIPTSLPLPTQEQQQRLFHY